MGRATLPGDPVKRSPLDTHGVDVVMRSPAAPVGSGTIFGGMVNAAGPKLPGEVPLIHCMAGGWGVSGVGNSPACSWMLAAVSTIRAATSGSEVARAILIRAAAASRA